MRVAIVVFPGSNCDRDVHHVLSDVGAEPFYAWHEDRLPDADAVVLPGGFSYGDRLRAGAIASHSPVMEGVGRAARAGVPVLGICNGFQILAEAGLLPGVLLHNGNARFMCRWTALVSGGRDTPFTKRMPNGTRMPVPVANGRGRYYADPDAIRAMERNGQIVFRYEGDVNGSSGNIAGVCSVEGNVLGLMPHPERAAEPDTNPDGYGPARSVFESLVGA